MKRLFALLLAAAMLLSLAACDNSGSASSGGTTFVPSGSAEGSGQETPGGDEPGDAPGGDEPGDAPGGDEPGDAPGGDEPGDAPGGDEPGTTPGGDEPGDAPGGDEPGTTPGGDEPGTTPGGDTPATPPERVGYWPEVTWGEYVSTYTKELPIFSVKTDEKVIALTIDVSWNNGNAEKLLELFEHYDIKATLFCMGYWVAARPHIAKAFIEAGHSLQSHSHWHHDYATEGWSTEDALAEILSASDIIEEVCGYRPTLFRFPSGDFNSELVAAVRGAGMEVIQWSVDSWDWMSTETVDTIYDRVMSNAHNGGIMLFHDSATYITMDVLPSIIEALLAEGYTFVTVDELLLTCPQYTIDFAGTMKPYN